MTLPNNLTYSQFLELAERTPSLEGLWIYRLEHTLLSNGVDYPRFDIYTNEYLFLTLEDAERLMRESLVNREATLSGLVSSDGPGECYHDHADALSLMKPCRAVPDEIAGVLKSFIK